MSDNAYCAQCGQETQHEIAYGSSDAACVECGLVNAALSAKYQYRDTYAGASGEYTRQIDDADTTYAQPATYEDDAQKRFYEITRREQQYFIQPNPSYTPPHGSIPLGAIGPQYRLGTSSSLGITDAESSFMRRAFEYFQRINRDEANHKSLGHRKGMNRQTTVPGRLRHPYQLAAGIALAVHESNLAHLANCPGLEMKKIAPFKDVGRTAPRALRLPAPGQIAMQMTKTGLPGPGDNITFQPGEFTTVLTRWTKAFHLPFDMYHTVMTQVVVARDRMRALAQADETTLIAIRSDRVSPPLELTDLEYFAQTTFDEWDQVVVVAHELYRMSQCVDLYGASISPTVIAIALVMWAVMGIRREVYHGCRAITADFAAVVDTVPNSINTKMSELRRQLCAWSSSFAEARLEVPVLKAPNRGPVGSGEQGWGSDARRSIPETEIAVASVMVLAQHWRTVYKVRLAHEGAMDYSTQLRNSRLMFAKRASEVYDPSTSTYNGRARLGEGLAAQMKRQSSLTPTPSESAPSPVTASTSIVDRDRDPSPDGGYIGFEAPHPYWYPRTDYAMEIPSPRMSPRAQVEMLLMDQGQSSDEEDYRSSDDEAEAEGNTILGLSGIGGMADLEGTITESRGRSKFAKARADRRSRSFIDSRHGTSPLGSSSTLDTPTGTTLRALTPTGIYSRGLTPSGSVDSQMSFVPRATARGPPDPDTEHVQVLSRERAEYRYRDIEAERRGGYRPPVEVEEYLHRWVAENVPVRISEKYLRSIQLSSFSRVERDEDGGEDAGKDKRGPQLWDKRDLQPWVSAQAYRWSPLEAVLRAGVRVEQLPLHLVPQSLLSVKRDLEHAPILASRPISPRLGPEYGEWQSIQERSLAEHVHRQKTQSMADDHFPVFFDTHEMLTIGSPDDALFDLVETDGLFRNTPERAELALSRYGLDMEGDGRDDEVAFERHLIKQQRAARSSLMAQVEEFGGVELQDFTFGARGVGVGVGVGALGLTLMDEDKWDDKAGAEWGGEVEVDGQGDGDGEWDWEADCRMNGEGEGESESESARLAESGGTPIRSGSVASAASASSFLEMSSTGKRKRLEGDANERAAKRTSVPTLLCAESDRFTTEPANTGPANSLLPAATFQLPIATLIPARPSLLSNRRSATPTLALAESHTATVIPAPGPTPITPQTPRIPTRLEYIEVATRAKVCVYQKDTLVRRARQFKPVKAQSERYNKTMEHRRRVVELQATRCGARATFLLHLARGAPPDMHEAASRALWWAIGEEGYEMEDVAIQSALKPKMMQRVSDEIKSGVKRADALKGKAVVGLGENEMMQWTMDVPGYGTVCVPEDQRVGVETAGMVPVWTPTPTPAPTPQPRQTPRSTPAPVAMLLPGSLQAVRPTPRAHVSVPGLPAPALVNAAVEGAEPAAPLGIVPQEKGNGKKRKKRADKADESQTLGRQSEGSGGEGGEGAGELREGVGNGGGKKPKPKRKSRAKAPVSKEGAEVEVQGDVEGVATQKSKPKRQRKSKGKDGGDGEDGNVENDGNGVEISVHPTSPGLVVEPVLPAVADAVAVNLNVSMDVDVDMDVQGQHGMDGGEEPMRVATLSSMISPMDLPLEDEQGIQVDSAPLLHLGEAQDTVSHTHTLRQSAPAVADMHPPNQNAQSNDPAANIAHSEHIPPVHPPAPNALLPVVAIPPAISSSAIAVPTITNLSPSAPSPSLPPMDHTAEDLSELANTATMWSNRQDYLHPPMVNMNQQFLMDDSPIPSVRPSPFLTNMPHPITPSRTYPFVAQPSTSSMHSNYHSPAGPSTFNPHFAPDTPHGQMQMANVPVDGMTQRPNLPSVQIAMNQHDLLETPHLAPMVRSHPTPHRVPFTRMHSTLRHLSPPHPQMPLGMASANVRMSERIGHYGGQSHISIQTHPQMQQLPPPSRGKSSPPRYPLPCPTPTTLWPMMPTPSSFSTAMSMPRLSASAGLAIDMSVQGDRVQHGLNVALTGHSMMMGSFAPVFPTRRDYMRKGVVRL